MHLLLTVLVACSPPPTPDAVPEPAAAPAAEAAPSEATEPEPEPVAPPPEPAPDPLALPALVDDQGNPLPQTKDRPSIESAAFRERTRLLWEAIVHDDPSVALPAFFPLIAYQRVKAIADPEKDWNRRLVAAYDRSVHTYHQRLGADAATAELVGVQIRDEKVRWMEPGSEGNALGYYRITRGKLRYRVPPAEAELELEITSMISWRGEWFVVHLDGFE